MRICLFLLFGRGAWLGFGLLWLNPNQPQYHIGSTRGLKHHSSPNPILEDPVILSRTNQSLILLCFMIKKKNLFQADHVLVGMILLFIVLFFFLLDGSIKQRVGGDDPQRWIFFLPCKIPLCCWVCAELGVLWINGGILGFFWKKVLDRLWFWIGFQLSIQGFFFWVGGTQIH